jgi:hypothetical protein
MGVVMMVMMTMMIVVGADDGDHRWSSLSENTLAGVKGRLLPEASALR